MIAALAIKTGLDPRGLLELLHDSPRVFDSVWYAAYPPVKRSVDEILKG